MIYPRKLTAKISKEIDSKRIVVLTGLRQTGKTTLMRIVFNQIKSENKVFLDLENPLNQKIFEEINYDNIILNLKELKINPEKKSYVFLDEVQLMPELISAIKYLYDHYDIKFFLTGSSSFYLKNLFSESLAGRKAIYELYPLDFEEFMTFREKEKRFFVDFSEKAKHKNKISFEVYRKLYDEYLMYGGFPGVVVEKENKRTILEDIFKSYFEKDVKALTDFKGIRALRDLILLLANRVGSKVEITKIASELGISRETVYSYMGFLEQTYFIFLVSPFSRSLDGEVRGARKIYFGDVGLLDYLGKVGEGAIFENAVFQNLKKYGKINYYAKFKGAEIDFIVNEKIGIEVKTHGDANDVKRLGKIAGNIKIKEYYVVTKNYLDSPEGILAIDL